MILVVDVRILLNFIFKIYVFILYWICLCFELCIVIRLNIEIKEYIEVFLKVIMSRDES